MSRTSRLGVVLALATYLLATGSAALATVIVPPTAVPRQVDALVASDGFGPEVVFDGQRFFAVWSAGGGSVVKGAFLGTDGEVLAPGVITIEAFDGWRPSVSYDGTSFLVAWRGAEASGGKVLAKRVGATGAVLDATPIDVATDVKQRRIGLAFDGTRHLAVWRTEGDQIRAARISTAGAPLDAPDGFLVGGGFYPQVEAAGDGFLVVWHAHGNELDVVGSLVTDDAAAAPFPIADDDLDQDHPAIATNGTDFMVTFKDRRFGDELNHSGTSAVRVRGDGTVLDDPPLEVSGHQWSQGTIPNVAWDGSDWVVAWAEDTAIKHRVVDAYLRRVSTDGAIVDADPVAVGTSYLHQGDPTIAVAGDRYLALFFDRGRCTYPHVCLSAAALDRVTGSPPLPPPAGAPQAELGSWQRFIPPVGSDVHAVVVLRDDLAYAATDEHGPPPDALNPLLRFDGSDWSVAAMQPNARKLDVFAIAEDRVWTAGGAGGTWVHWNGSTAYQAGNLFVGIDEPLLGQALAVRNFGQWQTFAVGSSGAAARYAGHEAITNQHGACRTLDDRPLVSHGEYDCDRVRDGFGLTDLAGNFPDDVYAAGETATLARFDGSDWALDASVPSAGAINGLYAACQGDLFAVGDGGTILRRQEQTWTRMGSPTTEHLYSVAGFGPSDVYAVGYGGTILHFDGTTWSPEASGTDNTLADVGTGGETVWVAGGREDPWNGVGPGTLVRKQRAIADATAPRSPQLRSRTHPTGVWTSDAQLRIELEGGCDDGRGLTGYATALDHDPDTVPPAVENLARSATHVTDAVSDGSWYFHLRSVDAAGNWSQTSHLGPLKVDTTPPTTPQPTSTTPAQNGWTGGPPRVNWSAATDATSGLAGYSFQMTEAAVAEPPATPTAGPSVRAYDAAHGDGLWFLHLKAIDHAGNASGAIHVGPLGVDTVAPGNPVVRLDSHAVGVLSSNARVAIGLQDPQDERSGVLGFSYSLDPSPAAEPDQVIEPEATDRIVDPPPLAAGDWYFRIRTVDNAGNWSQPTQPLGPIRIGSSVASPFTPAAIATSPIVAAPPLRLPTIRKLVIAPRSVAPGRPLRITIELAAPAAVTFRLERAAGGRRVGARCMPATRARRHRPACTRWQLLPGRIGRRLAPGSSTVTSAARIGGRLLRPGRHRLLATATNAAGRAPPRRAALTVARRVRDAPS